MIRATEIFNMKIHRYQVNVIIQDAFVTYDQQEI